jgi:hypothetical protein
MANIRLSPCNCTSDIVGNVAQLHYLKRNAWIPGFLVKLSKLKARLLMITPKFKMRDERTLHIGRVNCQKLSIFAQFGALRLE